MPSFISHSALLVILLVLSAFFSSSETAIFSLSKLEKRRLAKNHPGVWKTISALLESPRRTLITILIGNMFVNTMAIAIVTMMAVHSFGPRGVGWTIGIFTFVLLITGELTPKVFAVRFNERVAFLLAIPLDVTARVIFPVRRIFRWVSDWILSFLVRERESAVDLMSESELKALVRIGEEEGAFKSEEREMIQNLINLGDRIVREIMTPRTDMVAFDVEDGSEKLVALIRQSHFSYIPVFEKSLDHLLGVISTQEFMLSDRSQIRAFILPPYYVPETKPIDELLQEFQKAGHRVAFCVDEYGGTAGLVTLEDVLEEIFGEFYDEYAKAEPLVKTLGDDTFLVNGKIGLHELNTFLGISLASETSETLSGWLLEQFGVIPKLNESFRWQALEFVVKEMSRQRILKIEIRKKK